MPKLFLTIASISGILSVALGAFGAHALKDKLQSEGTYDTYQTAVQYQFYHTLALLGIAILLMKVQSQHLVYAGYSMTFGILIFSGSLYILCFTGIKWLGAITPIGGLLFILGWIFMLLSARG
ncbi:Uncharacterized membrane protein YgdD, TMEM256/DUF423 family [Ekhidna lutea]|uniref:Uncharacterized membrane protein YgdD, TMEM256/DUF423 family n=1 Tax=Ekhidna lutea TaxID=447679 RepID=A0A239LZF3_EKHLU|nr:DUF423 domain-containing protein [Ekhidna lutea]SNT35372.1 Uncharacterized membrane protein YgdD, TMEM256/DUF423 family [Ekhidna lutea]